jgi:hypothetical protein
MSERKAATRVIAWDGLAFRVPAAWDLARYARTRHGGRLLLEDAYSVRLELHWFRPWDGASLARLERRYQRQMAQAATGTPPPGFPAAWPPGWHAVACAPEAESGEQVALALTRPAGGRPLLLFWMVRSGARDRETATAALRGLAESLTVAAPGDPVAWDVLDVRACLPPDLALQRTLFRAGLKHLLFAGRNRRLALWQASLADLILKRDSGADWAAGLAARSALFPGAEFRALGEELQVARRRFSVAGRLQEWRVRAARYRAGWAHDPEANRLYLWVLQGRDPAALVLHGARFGPLDLAGDTRP